jgi:hypothetical protein
MTTTSRSDAAEAARLGPHLMIGGHLDGERREVDALITDTLSTVDVRASLREAGVDDPPMAPRDYVRVIYWRKVVEVRDRNGLFHFHYVYATDCELDDAGLTKLLIDGYGRK